MKVKLLSLLIVILCNSIFSQVMMGNYPIQAGNVWVYRPYYSAVGDPLVMSITDSTATIDSLTYHIVEYKTVSDTFYRLIRFDSTSDYAVARLDDGYPAPNHEYKYFKLNANFGDSWIVPDPAIPGERLFIDVFDSVGAFIFGEWTYIEQYYIHDSIYIYNYGEFWNPEFGLTSNVNDQGEPVELLTGCVINGIVYGDTSTVVGIQEVTQEVKDYKLEQNFPNPFNPTTTITYQIPKTSFVSLKIYDALGREAATLVNEQKNAGRHSINFNAAGLASGVYICRLNVDKYSESRKMILLK